MPSYKEAIGVCWTRNGRNDSQFLSGQLVATRELIEKLIAVVDLPNERERNVKINIFPNDNKKMSNHPDWYIHYNNYQPQPKPEPASVPPPTDSETPF